MSLLRRRKFLTDLRQLSIQFFQLLLREVCIIRPRHTFSHLVEQHNCLALLLCKLRHKILLLPLVLLRQKSSVITHGLELLQSAVVI